MNGTGLAGPPPGRRLMRTAVPVPLRLALALAISTLSACLPGAPEPPRPAEVAAGPDAAPGCADLGAGEIMETPDLALRCPVEASGQARLVLRHVDVTPPYILV